MSEKKLTIGLFGFGCVGFGLYEVLHKTAGLKANIKKICIKNKDKKREIEAQHFTYDKNDILNDDEINVVVELIDDADAAFEIVSAALKKGKAVVSANKKMIAEHFTELLELQKEYGAPLLYEAAACASMPIIRNLEEYYDNDLLESIEGIVNGSTNYILTKTLEENLSYEEALKQAQEKGFAESNPLLDVGGFDAKYKLLILLAHSFGYIAQPDDIFNIGIDNIGELELRYAKEKGLKIKLVAHAFKEEDGSLSAFVIPKFVSTEDRLYHVDDVFNGIITKTSFADTHFFVGRGAGAYPTASAVLSDISALGYDYKYEYKKIYQKENLVLLDDVLLKVLVRHQKEDTLLLKEQFVSIEEAYTNNDSGYITGNIFLKNIKDLYIDYNSRLSFVLLEVLFNKEKAVLYDLETA
ncbi:homoserine dehydrogenase [Flavobacterium arcticum]|uniref:Homoserine dehydrogenase n=1 Tax=Flavobacterium arcticum TaxID=1784713 RepID=A0A345HDA5_9FLAO|nr:homoserine dehydrogenase [Flavobacterium arcticum]AXG74565.1 homoserine dehydrogenase [Flavobacterium arcticum]KAF2512315.1 homoserine dehydrogenase [Flavobacterium arcticum]